MIDHETIMTVEELRAFNEAVQAYNAAVMPNAVSETQRDCASRGVYKTVQEIHHEAAMALVEKIGG